MRRFILLCALVALAFAEDPASDSDSDVVVIGNEGELDEFINENDVAMIEFYAPWCGHCKKLAPEYEAAATELKEDGVPIAKVDCTDEEGGKDVCGRYEVRGYPTLKFFQNGKDTPYEMERSQDAIVKYIRSRMGPAISVLTEADKAEKFSTSGDLVLIQFSAELHKDVDALANSMRDDMSFGHVADADIAKSLGAEMESIVLFRKFDEPKITYEGDVSEKDLNAFLLKNWFPLVGEIGPQNYKSYMDRGLPLMWIAVEKSDDPAVDWARKHAADFQETLSMVHIDGVQFASHIKNLGHEGDLPGIVITDGTKKFLLRDDVSEESLASFLKEYKDGTIEPFLKSQDIPEDNDGPVTVLVGKSFDDLVINNDKDVIVEFYAPWCGHCKKLEPEYDDLGDRWKDNENVVIAKMDATENDGPIEISGFPTLVFFKSGEKDKHEIYKGERTADGIDEFLKANAVHGSTEHTEL